MSIGPIWIPINLRKTTPDQMTVDSLKTQLDNIGLTCPDADPDKLEEYIKDVRSQLYDGKVQTFDILATSQSFRRSRIRSGLSPASSSNIYDYETVANGNWTDDWNFPDKHKLSFVNYEEHFDWLDKNRQEFPGIKNTPPVQEGSNATVEIIKKQFVEISVVASSVVVQGVDKQDIEGVMSNAIAPLNDSNLNDYDETDSRDIALSKNYNHENNRCDGVGMLSIWWHLFIKDYRKKDKDDPDRRYTLEVKAWSSLYDTLDALGEDYEVAKKQFPGAAAALERSLRMKAGRSVE